MKTNRAHGMVLGMVARKITVTLPDDRISEIRALVTAGQAASISAFVQHAVGIALSDAAGWKEMLQEALRQTGGPLTKKNASSLRHEDRPVPLPSQTIRAHFERGSPT